MSHSLNKIVGMKRSRPSVELAERVDMNVAEHKLQQHQGEWIRTTRYALGWVAADLARKLKISQQSLSRLEQREAQGSISLDKLEAVAQAMGCELVYGFIPHEPLTDRARDLHSRQEDAKLRHRKMPRPA